MYRKVVGLQEACLSKEGPNWPKSRSRGTKAKGRTYEKKVRSVLSYHFPAARFGEWIRYRDLHGTGFAQPDAFLALRDRLLCFECKLSSRQDGAGQIASLYKPLLYHIFGLPVVGVVVMKYIYSEPNYLIEDPREALSLPLHIEGVVWHFIG